MKKIMEFRNDVKDLLETHYEITLAILNNNKGIKNLIRSINLLGWIAVVLAIMYINFTICKVFIGLMLAYILFYIWICGFKSAFRQMFAIWFK